jgi:hypothetical protein
MGWCMLLQADGMGWCMLLQAERQIVVRAHLFMYYAVYCMSTELCQNSGLLSLGFHHGSPDSITEPLKKKMKFCCGMLLQPVPASSISLL